MNESLLKRAQDAANLSKELERVQSQKDSFLTLLEKTENELKQLEKEESHIVSELQKLMGIEPRVKRTTRGKGYQWRSYPKTVKDAIIETINNYPGGIKDKELERLVRRNYHGLIKENIASFKSNVYLLVHKGLVRKIAPGTFAPPEEVKEAVSVPVKVTPPSGFSLFKLTNNPVSDLFKD